MRIHFQGIPWDIYACLFYSFLVIGGMLSIGGGSLLALPIILFVPGYLATATIFPSDRDLDWVGRTAISVGLSITIVFLLGILLNYSPWGLRFGPVFSAIAITTALVGAAAYWRRMRLSFSDRLSATLEISFAEWNRSGTVDKTLAVVLVASVAVALGTIVYVLAKPPTGEPFTEFYLLGPSGNASGYPLVLNASQAGSVFLGVVNHEFSHVNYTVRIDLVELRIAANATSGFNDTVEVNRTTWSMFNLILDDGRNWTQPYTFRINDAGLWKVQFLLFKNGDVSSAYRELHLLIRVD